MRSPARDAMLRIFRKGRGLGVTVILFVSVRIHEIAQCRSEEARRSKTLARAGKNFCAVCEAGLDAIMAEQDSDRAWDEYEWERFLQQQDQKTEKYMELLEKYIDDPNRDEIVAREMGWYQGAEDEAEEWQDEMGIADEDSALPVDLVNDSGESFEQHSLYRASFNLTIWIDRLFESESQLQNDPAAVKLATHAALGAAKLAAALSDEEADELGMTIAYLKRSLKAITVAMDAAAQLFAEKTITRLQQAALQKRLFQVRDGIILLMGEFRGEWLRRYGSL